MSGNLFTAILSNFHVNGAAYVSRNEAGHDPMHKIRPFSNHLLTHFPTSFSSYENLTIDDSVCGFRGRVTFRVYIKNKSDKYGIKMFTVCEIKGMFCALKCILVMVNRTTQSLDCFKDYFLVILIRGIQFSWTDFTIHRKKDQSYRYLHSKSKRTATTKWCQKEMSVCS